MSGQRGLLDALLGVAYEDTPEADRAARLQTADGEESGELSLSRIGLLGGLLGLLEEEHDVPVTPFRKEPDPQPQPDEQATLASPGPDGRLLRRTLDEHDEQGPRFIIETASDVVATDEVTAAPAPDPTPAPVAVPVPPATPAVPPPPAAQVVPPPPAAQVVPPPPAAQVVPPPPAPAPMVPPPPPAPERMPIADAPGVAAAPSLVLVPELAPPVDTDTVPTPPEADLVPAAPSTPAVTEVPSAPLAPPVVDGAPSVLVAELDAHEIARRREALRGLFAVPLSPGIVEAVAGSLADPEVDIRHLALQVLERAPQLVPIAALQQAVYDTDPTVRARAMTLAGHTANPVVLPTVAARLRDESDPRTLSSGIDALASLARAGSLSEDALDQVCAIVGELAGRTRDALERELRLLSLAVRAGDLIDRFEHSNDAIRVGAAVLAANLDSPDVAKRLAARIDDDQAIVRQFATHAIARSRGLDAADDHAHMHEVRSGRRASDSSVERAVLPGLIGALADPQPEIRSQALAALTHLPADDVVNWVWTQSRSADADMLTRLLHVAAHLDLVAIVEPLADAIVRVAAVDRLPRSLGEAADSYRALRQRISEQAASSDPLERIAGLRVEAPLAAPSTDPIDRALDDPNADVRLAAIDVAIAASVVDRLARRLLEAVHSDRSPRVKLAAIAALEHHQGPERIAAVQSAIASDDPDVRIAAIALLNPARDAEFQHLATALRDPDRRIAHAAAARFKQQQATEGLALLWGQLRDSRGEVRQLVVDILATIAPDGLRRLARQAITSLDVSERVAGIAALAGTAVDSDLDEIARALNDPEPAVRVQALEALSAQPRALRVEPVANALVDPDAVVRTVAVRVAATIEDDSLVPKLVTSLDDPSPDVRQTALQALAAHPSTALVDLLEAQLDRPAHRAAAAQLLAIRGDQGLQRVVARVRQAQGTERDVLVAALRNSGVLDRVVAATTAPVAQQRAAALEVVGLIGDASVAPTVGQRLSDPDPAIRAKAATLLGDLGGDDARQLLRDAFGADPDMQVVAAIEQAYRKLAADG